MAKLKPGKKLPRNFRRIAKQQVNRVLCDLADPGHGGKRERVHDARKHLKKVRAALRLVRDELGKKAYKRDAAHFRKVARSLSPQRDAQVQLKTVEELLGDFRGREIREGLMKLHRILQGRLRADSRQPNGDREKLQNELRTARRHAKKFRVDALGWGDIACGIGQTYKRGSLTAQRAGRTHSAADLHEWRKRVKDLWYQLTFLKPPQDKPVTQLADRMKRLGQLLGDDHDLFMIEEAVANTSDLTCRQKEAIAKILRHRRVRLEKRAFQLGRKLFAEKPSEFIRRIERYGESPPQEHALY